MCKLYIYLVIGFISGCAHIGAASGPMKIVEEKVTVYLMDQTTYLNKLKGLFAEIVGHCAGYKID